MLVRLTRASNARRFEPVSSLAASRIVSINLGLNSSTILLHEKFDFHYRLGLDLGFNYDITGSRLSHRSSKSRYNAPMSGDSGQPSGKLPSERFLSFVLVLLIVVDWSEDEEEDDFWLRIAVSKTKISSHVSTRESFRMERIGDSPEIWDTSLKELPNR